MGDTSGYLSDPVAVLNPRTSPIGPARNARRHWRGRGMMDCVRIRDYLRVPSVRISFAVFCGSMTDWRMGDRRGDVDMIDDYKTMQRPLTSQHPICSGMCEVVDNQNGSQNINEWQPNLRRNQHLGMDEMMRGK